MKTLKLLVAALVLFSSVATAQNFRNKTVYLNTTDSSFHTIATIPTAANAAGILTVNIVGYAQDDDAAVTAVRVIRYLSVDGTITLGTPTTILAAVSDAGITGSAIQFAVSGSNILLQVKAGLPVPVRWVANIDKNSRVKIN